MLLKVCILLFISVYSVQGITPVRVPGYLGIYYGWPSLVQGSNGNLAKACAWFKQFNVVVFGDGIWKTSHGDRNNTLTIIRCLNGSNTLVFGYVDLGVNTSTQNLSQTQMQQAVDGWKIMGCYGIFWDDAGYDYGVTRARQNTMIQYSHSKNLSVIMNAWDPDHVMAGPNVFLNNKDIYLLESYLAGDGAYQSLLDWKIKADKCANYTKTLGVQMACVTTPSTNDQYTQAWFGTIIYNFHFFQKTDPAYSSNDNVLNYTANISPSYGSNWQTDTVVVNAAGANYSRTTETWRAYVVGNGVNWGYGTFQNATITG